MERTLRGDTGSIPELLDDELHCFLTVPSEQFEAKRLPIVHANSLSLIRFDRNSYSVPTRFAHPSLAVIAAASKVRFACR